MTTPDNDLKQSYNHAYWIVRQVLEVAEKSLESPHPLWGFLNELIEVRDRMEKDLDIPNKSGAFPLVNHD
jgi:hypothetical protein